MSHPDHGFELSGVVKDLLDWIADKSIPGGVLPPVEREADTVIEARIDLLGSGPARLTVVVPLDMAIGLTAAQTGCETAIHHYEDAQATVEELTNVLGGSVRSLLEVDTILDVPDSRVCARRDAIDGKLQVVHRLGTLWVDLAAPVLLGRTP